MKFSYKQLKLIIQFQIKLKLNITSYFYDFFEIFKCIYSLVNMINTLQCINNFKNATTQILLLLVF